MLGVGNALDAYATRLQELEVSRREAEVAAETAKADRAELLNQLVRDSDRERAKILAELTCPCREEGRRDYHGFKEEEENAGEDDEE